jgi:hypothetical protein
VWAERRICEVKLAVHKMQYVMVITISIIEFGQSPSNLSPEQSSFASPFTNFSDLTFD